MVRSETAAADRLRPVYIRPEEGRVELCARITDRAVDLGPPHQTHGRSGRSSRTRYRRRRDKVLQA